MTQPNQPYTSYVDGGWLPASSRVSVRENPGYSGDEAARWCPATSLVAVSAMDAAARAFALWSTMPVEARLELLDQLTGMIEANADGFAADITRENGKPIAEARAEIRAGLADAYHLLRQARRDAQPEAVSPPGAPIRSQIVSEPVGVYVLITPWNFPLAILLRKLLPALAYGNTVVVKPSELTPGPAHRLFALLARLDFPPGTASLVLGYGAEIGSSLIDHDALRGVSFTGSTATGLAIARRAAARDVRIQLEMGGKNSVVVLDDANLAAAVAATITGGFSCAGQWCTGTGRAIVASEVYDDFCTLLVAGAKALRVGPGDAVAVDIGPMITAGRVQATVAAIDQAVAAGARLRCGGQTRAITAGARGHYLSPAVLDRVTEAMSVFTDELFAPVIPVVAARDSAHALSLANAGGYGLSASVFSSDPGRAESFARRIEAGLVHVNLHTAYREPALPITAWRDSGRGIPECGTFARSFFTRPRSLYLHQP